MSDTNRAILSDADAADLIARVESAEADRDDKEEQLADVLFWHHVLVGVVRGITEKNNTGEPVSRHELEALYYKMRLVETRINDALQATDDALGGD